MDTRFVIFAFTLSLLCLLERILCCPENWPPPIDGQIYWSDYAASGKVLKIMDKDDSSPLYSVKFQVDCTYKGILPREITIDKAGINSKVCHKSIFEQGAKYIISVNETDPGRYETTFAPIAVTEDNLGQYMDELEISCGLESNFPTGMSDEDKDLVVCDLEVYPDDCETYVPDRNEPPTPAPPTTTQRSTYSPEAKANNTVIIPGEARKNVNDDNGNGSGVSFVISMLALCNSLLVTLLLA